MNRDVRWVFLLIALAALVLNLAADQTAWAVVSAMCCGGWVCSLVRRPND